MIKYEIIPSQNKKEEQKELPEKDTLINSYLFNKYKLLKKLGKGSFGCIYLCKEKNTNNFFAAKLENKQTSINILEQEYQIMNSIKSDKIPLIKKFGQNDNYNILIMQLLGKSLEQIFEEILFKQKMSLHCICNIAIQIIEILEQIHNKNIIHRDIKPSNFLLGNEINNNNILYLIDFGLAKKYRDEINNKHFEMKKGKKLIGTARFASINAMEGISQSRRDDLESAIYVLIYLFKGKLPWQNFLIKNKEERYYKIKEMKKNIDINILCEQCPKEFCEYIKYIKQLEYEEEPNYHFLRNLFNNILNENRFKFDYFYDWDNNKAMIDINQYIDFIEDENNLKLPLDKILYKKKIRKKRNKSQDKSTNDGGKEDDEYNNSSELMNFQNNSGCCIIV